MYSNTRLKVISCYCVMNSKIHQTHNQQENENLEVIFFHLKYMAMTMHNGNVTSNICFKQYLADERTEKKARCVDISNPILADCPLETFLQA